MIAFTERLPIGDFPSVQTSENTCKTYLFMKKKYFAPIEMLYNILEVQT